MGGSLEEKNVWFWDMDFVVLPSQALPDAPLVAARRLLKYYLVGHTCVMPNPLHSSSHSNLSVPFDGSK